MASEIAASRQEQGLVWQPAPACFLQPVRNLIITGRGVMMQRKSERFWRMRMGVRRDPVSAKALLNQGKRATVDQALSRIAERGYLIALAWCVSPSYRESVRLPRAFGRAGGRSRCRSARRGHRPERGGRSECPRLHDTSSNPVSLSGRSRTMKLGRQVVELRHAPRWEASVWLRRSLASRRKIAAAISPMPRNYCLPLPARAMPFRWFMILVRASGGDLRW